MLSALFVAAFFAQEPLLDTTPRSMLQHWLDLERAGRHGDAARLLDVPPERAGDAPELSRKLKATLDRHLWFDMSTISDAPGGRLEDGLPPDVDSLGEIPGPSGREQVLLARREGRWRFSEATVARIDVWFADLPGAWALERLPAPLLRPGPKDLLWWQWAALIFSLPIALVLGRLAARLTQAIGRALTRRTGRAWDDALVSRSHGPIATIWTAAFVWMLLPALGLYAPALAFVHSLLDTAIYVGLFWLALRAVDIGAALIAATEFAQRRKLATSLVPLGARSGKVFIVAIGAIAVLASLGYPVASLLAGLGIGGLAIALAAQKTVENVFGAFSIGVDQPFREGDFVKVEDFVGTVERIGLRSTRIRTLDRTLISLPNGKLADMRLETFAARDRIRLHCVLGLVYGTTATQMRTVLAELERMLRAHPKIWPEAVVVRFAAFGASSLDVEVMAWFETSDWNEFTSIRQVIFLDFMEIVERAGSSFAFPTRTVHLVKAS